MCRLCRHQVQDWEFVVNCTNVPNHEATLIMVKLFQLDTFSSILPPCTSCPEQPGPADVPVLFPARHLDSCYLLLRVGNPPPSFSFFLVGVICAAPVLDSMSARHLILQGFRRGMIQYMDYGGYDQVRTDILRQILLLHLQFEIMDFSFQFPKHYFCFQV